MGHVLRFPLLSIKCKTFFKWKLLGNKSVNNKISTWHYNSYIISSIKHQISRHGLRFKINIYFYAKNSHISGEDAKVDGMHMRHDIEL